MQGADAQRLPQPLRYLIVGAFNTALGYGIFACCYLALGDRLPYAAVLVLAHALAVSVSFASHRRWVFESQRSTGALALLRAWSRFQFAYVGLLLLGLAINGAMLRWVSPSPWLAQAAAMLAGVGAGWVLHRHYVFRP